MYKSIILPPAKEDIREAALWYNKRSKGLSKKFIDEVKKVRFIKQNTKVINVHYNNVRTTVLNVFLFMIHYTVDESNKIVIVSSVFHTSRDPELWENRIE